MLKVDKQILSLVYIRVLRGKKVVGQLKWDNFCCPLRRLCLRYMYMKIRGYWVMSQ